MLALAGFAVSNYFNKVKIALLEKGVEFTEEANYATKDDATLACSPLGKIPFLRTDQGPLCESTVIMEYLEDAFPQQPLLPKDPYQRAKVREVSLFLELHLELVARRLYPQAFFGGTVSQATIDEVREQLTKNVAAFSRLARFGPYLAGDSFTMADCAGIVHLPLVSLASKTIYGEDLLASLPVRDYMKLLGERPSVQRVNADRKTSLAQMAERSKKK
ncbi:MAG: glutathione S-transferase [Burkholderiales bacterium]|nr:glutathione S-transferase [Burkholderiales bacterium]